MRVKPKQLYVERKRVGGDTTEYLRRLTLDLQDAFDRLRDAANAPESEFLNWWIREDGDDLVIDPKSPPPAGRIELDAPVSIWPSHPAISDGQNRVTFDGTTEIDGLALNYYEIESKATIDAVGDIYGGAPSGLLIAAFSALRHTGTVTMVDTPDVFTFQLFAAAGVSQSEAGIPPANCDIFANVMTAQSTDDNSGTTALHRTVMSYPLLQTSGTADSVWTLTDVVGLWHEPRIRTTLAGQTMTVTNSSAVRVKNITKSGAGAEVLTNQIGLWLESLTSGANNWGIHSTMTSGANNFFLHHSGSAKSWLGGSLQVDGTTVNLNGLPTGAGGLATGDLWNNAGVVNIV
jgi:hypothetical protein